MLILNFSGHTLTIKETGNAWQLMSHLPKE